MAKRLTIGQVAVGGSIIAAASLAGVAPAHANDVITDPGACDLKCAGGPGGPPDVLLGDDVYERWATMSWDGFLKNVQVVFDKASSVPVVDLFLKGEV